MAGRRRAVPVLLVDRLTGISGLRRSAGRSVLPGGVQVISACAGPARVPDDLEPTEIHFAAIGDIGRAQAEQIEETLDVLLERAGELEHAHYGEPANPGRHSEPVLQTCRCGARRERPRGPHAWGEWA